MYSDNFLCEQGEEEEKREEDTKIDPLDLEAGLDEACKRVVFMSITNLVTGPPMLNPEVPDVLCFDRLRIKALHAHFHTDAACVVIINTVKDKLDVYVENVGDRESLLDTVIGIVISMPPLLTQAKRTTDLVVQALKQAGLSDEKTGEIKALIENNLGGSEYHRVASIAKRHWFEVMWKGSSQKMQNSGMIPERASSLIKVWLVFCCLFVLAYCCCRSSRSGFFLFSVYLHIMICLPETNFMTLG